MGESRMISLDEGEAHIFPEGNILYEPEEPVDRLKFIQSVISEVIERVIPEPKRVLTLEKAGKCLSVLGKIWNLTKYHEGCALLDCETSDQNLLDMEGYVEEYQYLHLEAVDMALTDIRIISKHFIWLLSVDVSGNRLTNISALPLTELVNLVSLKLSRNRIVDPYLSPIKTLQYLSMSSNKIESLHRIYHPNLLTLDIKWNFIKKVEGADCWKLKKLKQLDLRGNRLTTTAGIEYGNLVELYLAENAIQHLEGMEFLPNLKRLHLRKNPLFDLSGFTPENTCLEYLNLRSCKIESVEELQQLQVLNGLTVLVIKNNLFNPSREPGDKEDSDILLDDETDLRVQILTILPQLKRINKKSVTRQEVKMAKELLEEEKD